MAHFLRRYPFPRVVTPELNNTPSLVTFDAVAATPGSAGNAASMTWTHTVGSSANCLLVVLDLAYGSYQSPTPLSATANGTAMNLLSNIYWGPGNNWYPWLAVFGLLNPPTGSVSIVANFAATGLYVSQQSQSISYKNVSAFGQVVTTTSYSVIHSISAPSAPGNLLFNAFGTNLGPSSGGSPGYISSYSQNSRANIIFGYQNGDGLALGDSPGTGGPTTFTIQTSTTNTIAGGVIVPLLHS